MCFWANLYVCAAVCSCIMCIMYHVEVWFIMWCFNNLSFITSNSMLDNQSHSKPLDTILGIYDLPIQSHFAKLSWGPLTTRHVTSPIVLWNTILKPNVWHYGCGHLGFLEYTRVQETGCRGNSSASVLMRECEVMSS